MHHLPAVHVPDLRLQPCEKCGWKFARSEGFERAARDKALGQREAVEASCRRRRVAARINALQKRAFAPRHPDAERPAQKQGAGAEVFDKPLVTGHDAPTVGITPSAFVNAGFAVLRKTVAIKFHAWRRR